MSVISLNRTKPAQRWMLGAQLPATLSEVFAQTPAGGGAVGFVLSQLARSSLPIFWVQDRLSAKEAGVPYLPGIIRPFVMVHLSRPDEVLVAMEEGLRSGGLAAVVGEVWGAPSCLDFTATRRLVLRAEAMGVACWLIRRGAVPDLSAARNRWRVASLPSALHADDPLAPGDARWQVDLFRSRFADPGIWVARYDRAADRVDFIAAVPDRVLAEDARTEGRSAGA
jgi:protein ImuA